jgi:hypothetical protein
LRIAVCLLSANKTKDLQKQKTLSKLALDCNLDYRYFNKKQKVIIVISKRIIFLNIENINSVLSSSSATSLCLY